MGAPKENNLNIRHLERPLEKLQNKTKQKHTQKNPLNVLSLKAC